MEDENEAAKASIPALTKELDHLTLTHSQILVENTKLTNDKLRLEQEVRKTESRCDLTIRSMHDKFNKEVSFPIAVIGLDYNRNLVRTVCKS